MDECWLDVSDSKIICGDAMKIAEDIRSATREELGLTVSIGVSYNKIFAKLGSDMKKPDAITEITKSNFKEKVWPLPASDMIYVGPATTRKLASYGVTTIGELAALDPAFLKGLLGVNGVALWTFANGTDQSRVMQQGFVSPVKSIGHGITCVSDLLNEEEVWKVILELSQDIGHKLRIHELAARTVQVFVRGNNLSYSQFQCKLPFKTQLPSEIAAMAFQAFKEHYRWGTKVRAVTVRAIELVPKNQPEQLTLFVDHAQRDKLERLQDAIEEIRGRFGKRAITNAVLLGDLKMPDDGRDTVKMPGLMYR